MYVWLQVCAKVTHSTRESSRTMHNSFGLPIVRLLPVSSEEKLEGLHNTQD
jgi:hypothetical protein